MHALEHVPFIRARHVENTLASEDILASGAQKFAQPSFQLFDVHRGVHHLDPDAGHGFIVLMLGVGIEELGVLLQRRVQAERVDSKDRIDVHRGVLGFNYGGPGVDRSDLLHQRRFIVVGLEKVRLV